MLSSIVTFVGSSSKRANLLKEIQEAEIAESSADGNLETGKVLNQIRSLKRAGMTRWGSHFASVNNLVHMFKEVSQLLQNMMIDKELAGSIRGDAKGFLKSLKAFDFVFCLLLTNKIMGITDLLSQALQRQSQDIVNAMNLVSSTKTLLQELREHGWINFFQSVQQFGDDQGLDMPNMDAPYSMGTGRENFYPEEFDTSEVRALKLQLEHYKCQVVSDKDFQELSSLAQVCRRLVETGLEKKFPLVDMLIRLVLTLPVSTTTTERAFSAMKIIKTRLRNKMEDEFLSGCMMLHIEKEYVDDIDSEAVIDHFESTGDHRAQFR
ncbi:uncharacterized protein LOC141673982 [Apium graveolens]|uniref:uncharacterized protein LOC141673982 n=1 Tax=Apium graveolens TaxID=4045 RepID=UPI003D798403